MTELFELPQIISARTAAASTASACSAAHQRARRHDAEEAELAKLYTNVWRTSSSRPPTSCT